MPPPSRLIVWKIFNFIALDGRSEEKNNESFCYSKTHRYFYKKNCRQKFCPQLKKHINLFSPANWLRQRQQFRTSPLRHRALFSPAVRAAASAAPAKNKAPHSLTSVPCTALSSHQAPSCATSPSCCCATATAAGPRPRSASVLAYPPAADCAKALSFSYRVRRQPAPAQEAEVIRQRRIAIFFIIYSSKKITCRHLQPRCLFDFSIIEEGWQVSIA